MSVTRPSSPDDIDEHEETVVLFWDESIGEEWFDGEEFETVLREVEQEIKGDNLSISLRKDGLERKTSTESLLLNSVWVIREECLINDNIYEKRFLPYFANISIPPNTQVVYCADRNDDVAASRMRSICDSAICAPNKDRFIGTVLPYFTKHNPDRGVVGRKAIYRWYKNVWELINGYD